MYKFGDKVYVEFSESFMLVVIEHRGEDVCLVDYTGKITSINGSFVWPWREKND